MRPVARTALALAAAWGAAAAPAAAQGLALELRAGYFDMTNAPRSAQALFAERGGPLAGAALRVDLGDSLFARVGASVFRQTGERVFVEGDDVFRLGHPLELRLVPAYVDVARRFFRDRSFRPYVGFGVGAVLLQETSEVAGETLTDERAKLSTRALVGATLGQGRLQIGIEAAYSRAPNAVGIGGVSQEYGENDVGGVSAVATFTWRP